MNQIVPAGSDFKSPAAVAIASVEPYMDEREIVQRFRTLELLFCAMMDAGGQFHRKRHSYNDAWDFIPPTRPVTHDEALALAWGQQLLAGDTVGCPTLGKFYGRALFPHTWSLDYAADVLGVTPKRAWEMFRDGALGGYEARQGIYRIAPGSVERYQQRQQRKAA